MYKLVSFCIFLAYFLSNHAAHDEVKKSHGHKLYCMSKFFAYACKATLVSTLVYTGYKAHYDLKQIYQAPWYQQPVLYGEGFIKGILSSGRLIFTCLKLYVLEKIASLFTTFYCPYTLSNAHNHQHLNSLPKKPLPS